MITRLNADILINTNLIKCVMTYSSKISKSIYKEALSKDKLLNLTKNRQCRSIMLLTDGSVIALDIRTDTLLKRLSNTESEKNAEN